MEGDIEKEANYFACEFLMPAKELTPQIAGSKLTLAKLADLKIFWKVSMQAILTLSEHLGLITKNHAKYIWSQINALRMRVKEPNDIPVEKSSILERLIQTYLKDLNYTKHELMKLLCLNQRDYTTMYNWTPFLVTR